MRLLREVDFSFNGTELANSKYTLLDFLAHICYTTRQRNILDV